MLHDLLHTVSTQLSQWHLPPWPVLRGPDLAACPAASAIVPKTALTNEGVLKKKKELINKFRNLLISCIPT